MRKFSFLICISAAGMATLGAQDIRRHAAVGRGGGPGGGERCTVDVVVDGSAEVEIRGDDAVMRNLSGQAPQFRQFECTRPIPANPPNFRFSEVDGRGRQELVRSPRDGGVAVVRIEDPQSGSGEYRFELMWGGGGDGDRRDMDRRDQRGGGDGDREHQQYQQDRDRFFQGEAWRRNLFQRVREDVEHVQHSTFPFTGDQSRLGQTITELNELQGKLSAGHYDERELDQVLGALGSVVQNNRLSPRDRDVLNDDLRRMREFRDHHDDYGARFQRN